MPKNLITKYADELENVLMFAEPDPGWKPKR